MQDKLNVEIIFSTISLILSIFALIVSVKNYIRDKGKIKIIPSVYNEVMVDHGEYGVELEEIIEIKIVNVGRRPLTIEKLFIMFSDKTYTLIEKKKETLNEKFDYTFRNIKENFLMELFKYKENVNVIEIIVQCSDGEQFRKKLTSKEIKEYF